MNRIHLGLFALAGATLLAGTHHASAMTMKECGASYQAAKKDGTLAGMDWHTYQASKCSATAAATPAAAPAPGAAMTPAPAVAATHPAETKPVVAAAPAAAGGSAVFPTKVDPKYASLSAGKQRMKTCDDQYKANKAGGGNGGMKWIQKGGGYWPECNKHLKG